MTILFRLLALACALWLAGCLRSAAPAVRQYQRIRRRAGRQRTPRARHCMGRVGAIRNPSG